MGLFIKDIQIIQRRLHLFARHFPLDTIVPKSDILLAERLVELALPFVVGAVVSSVEKPVPLGLDRVGVTAGEGGHAVEQQDAANQKKP